MTDKANSSNQLHISTVLREISAQDFLNFGIHDVAYVNDVMVDGENTFVIHAADGTPLSTAESHDSALVTIRQNDLEAVSIH